MLIIPEINTIVVFPPRTASRSLKNALLSRYKKAFLLYRHMEADGVPFGYDRWTRVGVVRHPVDRLWSLYKYLQDFGDGWKEYDNHTYVKNMRKSVSVPFEDWLLHNELPFTTPYDTDGLGRFWPEYAVRHPIPENRKSQFVYLRPDLGTKVVRYDNLKVLHEQLDIAGIVWYENVTPLSDPPPLSQEANDYVNRWFAWDLKETNVDQ